jgi:putative spermidine/putrescine transport system permease protein
MSTIEATYAGRPARKRSARLGRPFRIKVEAIVLGVLATIAYLFVLAPMIVVIGASLHGRGFYTAAQFPPTDISLHWYTQIPFAQLKALGLSLVLGATTAMLAGVLGLPAAIAIARANFPGRALVAALFRAPLQIPAVVTGIAFLQLYYILLARTGVDLPGGFVGLVIAHTFIGLPFVIGSVTAVLQRFDLRLEEAAAILGAPPWRVFRRVTLPVIMPGVYAGALYAFMISFADVPVAIFLTAPGYQTYPVEIFQVLENDFTPAVLASATIVILFCFVLLLLVQRIVGLDTLLRSGGGR